MGIDKFNEFGRLKAPHAYTVVPVHKFENTRVFIDAYNLLYNRMYKSNAASYNGVNLKLDPHAQPDEESRNKFWYSTVIEFAVTMMGLGITPVFVFDGKNMPAKEKCRIKRSEKKKQTVKQIRELTATLDAKSVLDRDDDEVTKLRNLKKSVTYISRDLIDMVINILVNAGIPTIVADGDGENLCCALVREGKGSAVYSTDTDCIALGCPIMITGITKNSRRTGMTFDVILFDRIFSAVGLTYPQFIDLCIMGGTDYSESLPGVKLLTAHRLLLTYGSIEEIGKVRDIKCLDHEYCRETIYGSHPSDELLDERYPMIGPGGGTRVKRAMPYLNVDIMRATSDMIRTLFQSVGIDGQNIMGFYAVVKKTMKVRDAGAEEILKEGRVVFNHGSVPIRIVTDDTPVDLGFLPGAFSESGPSGYSSGTTGPNITLDEGITINPLTIADPVRDILRIN